MNERRFEPGFRFSTLDALVLVAGAAGTALFWAVAWWAGFVVAFVVGHFFLFCNVFRVPRLLELVWGGLFTSLAAATVSTGQPPWSVTIGLSLVATALVVAAAMRRADYHGVGWERVNPGLPDWWATRCAENAVPADAHADNSSTAPS